MPIKEVKFHSMSFTGPHLTLHNRNKSNQSECKVLRKDDPNLDYEYDQIKIKSLVPN
jgi:hypothetical protein